MDSDIASSSLAAADAPAPPDLPKPLLMADGKPAVARQRHHVLLILSGLAVAAALGYAAVRIRDLGREVEELEQEVRHLQEQRDGLLGVQTQGETWRTRALEETGRKQNLERTLAALRDELGASKALSATREKELQQVIQFMREEIKAAEATIRRLAAEPPLGGRGAPEKTDLPK